VKRISGQPFDQALLGQINASLIVPVDAFSEMLAQRGYAAAFDAPSLVNTAREHGADGTALVDSYVDAHAGYNYVEYRNGSLWLVLDAVLLYHPDQNWVRERLGRVLVAALTGGGIEFVEMLPLTLSTLFERARMGGDPRSSLDRSRSDAVAKADELCNKRCENDSWAIHKRRFTALVELYALILKDTEAALALVRRTGLRAPDEAPDTRELPLGFAGFQAPATLRLADALRACTLDSAARLSAALESALRAAHNIQDSHFAARVTARCNALQRWHARALNDEDLATTMRELAEAPDQVQFATDHLVRESFRFRRENDPDGLTIEPARAAVTVRRSTPSGRVDARTVMWSAVQRV
jgi:hypothetical protein